MQVRQVMLGYFVVTIENRVLSCLLYIQSEHGLAKYSRRNMDNKKTHILRLHRRSFGHWSLTDDIEHHTFFDALLQSLYNSNPKFISVHIR